MNKTKVFIKRLLISIASLYNAATGNQICAVHGVAAVI